MSNKHQLKKINFILGLLATLVLGCIKGKEPALPPAKALLTFPFKNEICAAGENPTPTESTIHFDWTDAANADGYLLSLKNLKTGAITEATSKTSDVKLTLPRATPFSWSVTSVSSKTTVTAVSDTWKFYNSGVGQLSYAPFPASLVYPTMGQAVDVTGNSITLTWSGSDVDGDIAGYDIYIGKNSTLALAGTTKPNNQSLAVAVTANTIYYWKVVTKDAQGNSSESEVYQFKVN